ncbi:MAG: hypothetical protein WCF57_10450 [Pyrinomonadaceae bacterium]
MAILTSVQEGGEAKFYDVPDDQLQQYAMETEKKDDAGGETPEGRMPAALMSSGGDVQAYSGTICYVRRGRRIWWWYC